MSKKRHGKLSKKKKGIIIGSGVACFALLGGFLWFSSQTKTSKDSVDTAYTISEVTQGNVASSTLLTGNVKANQEQYVYYDSSQGTNATVTVSVGDQVTQGQQLVQYDTATAQAAYDTAVRALNKVGRQIDYLKTYGNLPTTTTTTDEETGETITETQQPTAQQTADYNQQLQSLNDAYADAQAEVNKAQDSLNKTIIVSDVSGTVVEVNNNVNTSSKDSQTLVHVVSEGQLQVKGTLTEYDLANIHTGQTVKITSKVYPDQEWTGTISYISNYPNQDATTSTDGSTTNSSSKTYDYKVDISGDLTNLKQGFTVSVEVANDNQYKLVPASAVVSEGDKSYIWVYDGSTKKASKTEVSLGNADATNQEITAGLEVGQKVISNPDNNLSDGNKVENVTTDTGDSSDTAKETD